LAFAGDSTMTILLAANATLRWGGRAVLRGRTVV
jgi:hypothetical protein